MVIYLIGETNFLVDLGLEQDQNVKNLAELAAAQRITIAIPQVSFSEVQGVLVSIGKRRINLASMLRQEANQIKRSLYHSSVAERLKEGAELLERSYQEDIVFSKEELQLLTCVMIQYTPEIHSNAYLTTLDKRYDLTEPDASIYESIKDFAKGTNGIKIHLNKNSRDFDKPIIHKELEDIGVELYFSSGEVIRRIYELIS